eukprot:6196633-Amphidinium_carterae.1
MPAALPGGSSRTPRVARTASTATGFIGRLRTSGERFRVSCHAVTAHSQPLGTNRPVMELRLHEGTSAKGTI